MPCEDLSLSDLQEVLHKLESYRGTLEEQKIEYYKQILCATGQYLVQTRPSEIKGKYVVKIEEFLNDLSQQLEYREQIPIDIDEIIDEIDEVVGIAGTLTEITKNIDESRRHRHPDFGKYVKKLGRKLKFIGGIIGGN